ncbi:hypothetical protein ScPMuIL_015461 [Solemya velum]
MFLQLLVCLLLVGTEADVYPGGWELVFRAIQGNGERVYHAWKTGSDNMKTFSEGCDKVYVHPGKHHFRSSLIDEWELLEIEQVKIELYKDNKRTTYIIFNGTDSDMLNWFHQSRILASSWSDLTVGATYNKFSIEGHAPRRFFINEQYGGCPNDFGWLTILDPATKKHPCNWDTQDSYPAFLYAPTDTKVKWHLGEYSLADIMAVYIKYNN